MNAAEQANNYELASQIATVVNLFKAELPKIRVDLKPWRNDPGTQELVDPESIDIGFHFPGWSRAFQSRSLLVQIRFYEDPVEGRRRAIGIEASGYDHRGQRWQLSTVGQWRFAGESVPEPKAQERLKGLFYKVFELFNRESE